MKTRGFKFLVATLLAVCGLAVFIFFKQSPGIEAYNHLQWKGKTSQLHVTFLGTSSLLFDDGETAWMTDGFFTRPGLIEVAFGKIAPDEKIISQSLERLKVNRLSAVIPIHSHYDHALDSSRVAQKTGAVLIGSLSTMNIGSGSGLTDDKMEMVIPGDSVQLGKFKIIFIASKHSPGAFYEGAINEPLKPPQSADKYKMGDCYSLLVEHQGRSFLVHGSPGYLPGALKGHKAEVVFLGIGTLGKQSLEFKENFWNEVVKTTGAQQVVLTHWDHFFKPLSEELKPLPWPIDDFKASMDFLSLKGQTEYVDIRLPVLWQKTGF